MTGNVISANGHKSPSQALPDSGLGYVGTTNNVIAGNFIGTDKTGTIGTGLGNIGDNGVTSLVELPGTPLAVRSTPSAMPPAATSFPTAPSTASHLGRRYERHQS